MCSIKDCYKVCYENNLYTSFVQKVRGLPSKLPFLLSDYHGIRPNAGFKFCDALDILNEAVLLKMLSEIM